MSTWQSISEKWGAKSSTTEPEEQEAVLGRRSGGSNRGWRMEFCEMTEVLVLRSASSSGSNASRRDLWIGKLWWECQHWNIRLGRDRKEKRNLNRASRRRVSRRTSRGSSRTPTLAGPPPPPLLLIQEFDRDKEYKQQHELTSIVVGLCYDAVVAIGLSRCDSADLNLNCQNILLDKYIFKARRANAKPHRQARAISRG